MATFDWQERERESNGIKRCIAATLAGGLVDGNAQQTHPKSYHGCGTAASGARSSSPSRRGAGWPSDARPPQAHRRHL